MVKIVRKKNPDLLNPSTEPAWFYLSKLYRMPSPFPYNACI